MQLSERTVTAMTVDNFYKTCECKSVLKVMHAGSGRVLAHRYNPDKHFEIGMLEIRAIWAELKITDSGFGNYCCPILCCYAVENVRENE